MDIRGLLIGGQAGPLPDEAEVTRHQTGVAEQQAAQPVSREMQQAYSQNTSQNAATRLGLRRQNATVRGAQLVAAAQENMQYGQLVLTGSSTSERGQLFYHGYYQPTNAMDIAGTTFADVAPGQLHLIHEHLEFYKDEFNEGENAQIQAVELAPTEQGQLGILDGHHRLAAGLSLAKPVPLLINLDTEPAAATDWSQVQVVLHTSGSNEEE